MSNIVFIWLDDFRIPPSKDWSVAKTADEAYALFKTVPADRSILLSLDHDLGDNIPTGYDLLNWIERDIATNPNFRPDVMFRIHSANPVGRANMDRAIKSIERLLLNGNK